MKLTQLYKITNINLYNIRGYLLFDEITKNNHCKHKLTLHYRRKYNNMNNI